MAELSDLRKIAHLRASGFSWSRIAGEFNTSESSVLRWTKKDPDRWKRLYALAVRQIARECTAEAVIHLRHDLRSEDGKERRDAAQKLLSYSQKLHANSQAKPDKTQGLNSQKTTATTLKIAKYVESLNSEQLDRLIQELQQGE
jgi:hypothetical protein